MNRGGGSRGPRPLRRTGPLSVMLAGAALVLGACTGSPDEGVPEPTASRGTPAKAPAPDPVTLTIASYLGGGPGAQLLAEYDGAHPEVVLEIAPTDYLSSQMPSLEDDLESGAELTDVVAYGDGSTGQVLAAGDRFVDLREHGLDARADEVLPWSLVHGTDAAGRLVGFPTEVAPEALCFRRDLLAAAGIAADGDELADLIEAGGGGWDAYFDLGRRYHEATGRAWFDISGSLWFSMARQLPTGYTSLDGTALAHQDAELRARWDLLTGAIADGLSAHQRPNEWNWGVSFVDGTFATMVCSPTMAWVVEDFTRRGGGGPATGWEVADVMPGGGSSWGSTTAYLAVPATSAHPDEAAALIHWLTDPAQQVRLYRPRGMGLPSTRAAIQQVVAAAEPSEFFGGVVLEEVFAARAEEVRPHVAGPHDWPVSMWFGSALGWLEDGRLPSADAAWEQSIGDMHTIISGRSPLDVRPPT